MPRYEHLSSLTVGVACLCLALGCWRPQPSAPHPKGGYRTEKISYDPKPNPLATLLKLGDIQLVEDHPLIIPSEQIPTVERRKLFAVEGVIIHPDHRMEGGDVFVKLLIPNSKSPDGFDVANESVIRAKGKGGRLEYHVEVRVPDSGPQQYVLKMVYSGYIPGIQAGETPEPWVFPFAEGVLKVAGPPKPR